MFALPLNCTHPLALPILTKTFPEPVSSISISSPAQALPSPGHPHTLQLQKGSTPQRTEDIHDLAPSMSPTASPSLPASPLVPLPPPTSSSSCLLHSECCSSPPALPSSVPLSYPIGGSAQRSCLRSLCLEDLPREVYPAKPVRMKPQAGGSSISSGWSLSQRPLGARARWCVSLADSRLCSEEAITLWSQPQSVPPLPYLLKAQLP